MVSSSLLALCVRVGDVSNQGSVHLFDTLPHSLVVLFHDGLFSGFGLSAFESQTFLELSPQALHSSIIENRLRRVPIVVIAKPISVLQCQHFTVV